MGRLAAERLVACLREDRPTAPTFQKLPLVVYWRDEGRPAEAALSMDQAKG